jgi:hypothetical protein
VWCYELPCFVSKNFCAHGRSQNATTTLVGGPVMHQGWYTGLPTSDRYLINHLTSHPLHLLICRYHLPFILNECVGSSLPNSRQLSRVLAALVWLTLAPGALW